MLRLHRKLIQRFPPWGVWLIYMGTAAGVLWVLMMGFGIWLFTFGLKPNAKALYRDVIDNPRNHARRLRSGGYSWMGHDVWLTFESDQAIRLKDPLGFTAMEPGDIAKLNLAEDGCEKIIQASPKPVVLYRTNTQTHTANGELFVHDLATNRYCYQSWFYD